MTFWPQLQFKSQSPLKSDSHTNPDKMKVEPTRLIKEVLNDPKARKQLAAAIANPSLTVTLKGKTYMLENIR